MHRAAPRSRPSVGHVQQRRSADAPTSRGVARRRRRPSRQTSTPATVTSRATTSPFGPRDQAADQHRHAADQPRGTAGGCTPAVPEAPGAARSSRRRRRCADDDGEAGPVDEQAGDDDRAEADADPDRGRQVAAGARRSAARAASRRRRARRDGAAGRRRCAGARRGRPARARSSVRHGHQTSSSSASLALTTSSIAAGVLGGELVELGLGAVDVVLAGLAVLDQLVERVLGVAADRADRHLGVLALALGDLDQVAAALLGELREDDADDRAVVGRVDAEVAVADGLLDRAELRRRRRA